MQDIHTHLYWQSYDTDRDAVVARAQAAGVESLIVVGCTIEESKQAVALAETQEHIWASVGIHPQTFDELGEGVGYTRSEVWREELQKLAQHPKVVAIGECGLEYFRRSGETAITPEQKAVQRAGFRAQIAIAQSLGLPVMVHARATTGTQDVYEDLLALLGNYPDVRGFVLHCFMGDTEMTRRFLELSNVWFSFAGNITFPVKKALIGSKDDLRESVKLIPLARMFVETDCPFLAPQAHRGERNESAFVRETLALVAELHGVTQEVAETQLAENWAQVFSFPDKKGV